MDTDLLPFGPGAYTEWATLYGAPTHWEAVLIETDVAYVQSGTFGARDSFRIWVPSDLRAEDVILFLALRHWMSWPWNITGIPARSIPFYRVRGVNHDLPDCAVYPFDPGDPTAPGPVIEMGPLAISGLSPLDLRDGAIEVGMRRSNNQKVRLHSIRGHLELGAYSDRIAFAGGGGRVR